MSKPLYRSASFISTDVLADAAIVRHAGSLLARGGLQRAQSDIAKGASLDAALATAARTAKGNVGELLQAARYSARAGAHGGSHYARLTPSANHPTDDIQLMRRSGHVSRGIQVKVGSKRYVKAAVRSKKYGHIVANEEAVTLLTPTDAVPGVVVVDQLAHRGIEAGTLRESECVAITTEQLTSAIAASGRVGQIDVAARALKAGAGEALVSISFHIVGDVLEALWSGLPIDLGASIRNAVEPVAKSAARTTLATTALLMRFEREARRAFSGRLLYRITRNAHYVGAIAEVIVETASDLLAVMRNQLTLDELLRRFGVHTMTAAGGALGAIVAIALTGGVSLWITALAAFVGGTLGARAGCAVGEQLFMPEAHRLLTAGR